MRGPLSFLAPPAPAPPLPEAQGIQLFRLWRIRQISALFIGYAVFYFVRKNLPVAMPDLQRSMGIGTAQLGLFLTLHDLLYGVSKFGNGVIGDRSNPRILMAAGLFLSAITNLCFGMTSGVVALGLWWLLNGWFQGMGFPPCARILSHWSAAHERGVIWGMWNASHQVGAAGIFVLAGYLVSHYGWRSGFVIPAVIALSVSLFLAVRLRDTPQSLGLPSAEDFARHPLHTRQSSPQVHANPAGLAQKKEPGPRSEARSEAHSQTSDEEFRAYLHRYVFGNAEIWLLCLANFFVYVIRYGVMNWAPMYLSNVRGQSMLHASTSVAGFEIAGLIGALAAGWLRDRVFAGRCAQLACAYMLATGAALLALWKLPLLGPHAPSDAAVLLLIGFCIYGPQFLVGICAATLVGPRAVATAIGLTGLFGYASSAVSGLGFGVLVGRSGWDAPFLCMVVGAAASALCFVLLAPAEARASTRTAE